MLICPAVSPAGVGAFEGDLEKTPFKTGVFVGWDEKAPGGSGVLRVEQGLPSSRLKRSQEKQESVISGQLSVVSGSWSENGGGSDEDFEVHGFQKLENCVNGRIGIFAEWTPAGAGFEGKDDRLVVIFLRIAHLNAHSNDSFSMYCWSLCGTSRS